MQAKKLSKRSLRDGKPFASRDDVTLGVVCLSCVPGNRAPWYAPRESPTDVGRSSGQMTPRRTANLNPKGGGDKSMTVKRGASEGVYGCGPATPERYG